MTNGTNQGAKYRFVPYARQGYRPTDEFKTGAPDAAGQPTFGVDVTPKAKRRAEDRQGGKTWDTDSTKRTVDLSLYGPGDVQGIDTDQIVRVEPEPDTAEFPANYFPFVEFDRPDLPWMFSPERGDDAGRTRPWLTLIVVTDDDAIDVSVGGRRPAPVLTFGSDADLDRELPDLRETWAWAHVQAHGSPEGKGQSNWASWLPQELQKTSNITVSRIVSPRNLQPETDYVACLVPTFKPGRLAGLGKAPYGDGKSQQNGGNQGNGKNKRGENRTVSLAWDVTSLPELPFELPLYHYWRFTAGEEGTFESLVRKLDPVELGASVGKKAVDVGDPGPDSLVPQGSPPTVDVAGALTSVPAKASLQADGVGLADAKTDRLRRLLNKPETLGSTQSSGDAKFPIVGPHLYGQWHAGLVGIPAEGAADPGEYDPQWFRQLNVTLRNRVAASIGAQVVKEHQNQLMDAAWEVVGEVREANKFVRAHQGVEAVGNAIENWDGGIGDAGERGSRFDNPWAVRRDLDRLQKLGAVDLDDLGSGIGGGSGLGGDSPGDSGVVDPATPEDGTTQPVEPEATGEPSQPAETPEGGGLGSGTGAGVGTTQPSRLASTYLDAGRMGDVVSGDRLRAPDGGVAAGASPGGSATNAATYTQYLETFLAQPETSLQYQRLVRLDGPLGRRVGIDNADYQRTLRRASLRAAREVGTAADGALGGTPGGLSTGTADAATPVDRQATDASAPMSTTDPGDTTDTTGDRTGTGDGRFGTTMLVDPETLAGAGESQPTGGQAGAGTTGGESGTGEAGDVLAAGTLEADRLSMPTSERLPRTRRLATRRASRAALDARVATPSVDYEPAADARPSTDRERGERTVRGVADSIREHLRATAERVRAAERALAEDGTSESAEPPAATVLSAHEAAQPVAYALDPFDRALSKVVADESVTVAEQLTEAYKDDRLVDLHDAYDDLLGALTAAHGALAGPDAADGGSGGEASGGGADAGGGDSGAETGRASSGGGAGAGPGSGGGSTGSGSTGGGSHGGGGTHGGGTGVDPPDALADATDHIDAADGIVAELVGLLTPTPTSATVPAPLEPDPSGSMATALDPRRERALTPDLGVVDTQLATRSSEGRYRRSLLTERVSFLSGDFVKSDDPVDRVMVAPEFPTPMWRPLKALDEEYLLPGADAVEPNSVGLVVQNREFIESYMVGVSHEMARELLWRRYPNDRSGTYFRRFWNRGKGPGWSPGSEFRVGADVPSKDIEEIHEWDEAKLRCNAPGGTDLNKVVLLLRGQLFDRYPNTVVYAARAKTVKEEGRIAVEPMTPERFVKRTNPDPDDIKFPTFRGSIGSDITFLGFDLDLEDVHADQQEIKEVVENGKVPPEGQNLGWYFVFEERPGETRFGFDVGRKEFAGTRPYGVVDKSGQPRYATKSNGSKRNFTPDDPVGWDGLSWYHLVEKPGELSSMSYVPVGDSPPGKNDWKVEEGAGNVAQYMEAAAGFEPTDEAEWGQNSAQMARIAWQKPVRVSFHAHELLPDEVPSPSDGGYCQ